MIQPQHAPALSIALAAKRPLEASPSPILARAISARREAIIAQDGAADRKNQPLRRLMQAAFLRASYL